MVTVCTIAPNFNIEDVDPELTADGTPQNTPQTLSQLTLLFAPSAHVENLRFINIFRTTPA